MPNKDGPGAQGPGRIWAMAHMGYVPGFYTLTIHKMFAASQFTPHLVIINLMFTTSQVRRERQLITCSHFTNLLNLDIFIQTSDLGVEKKSLF